MARNYTKKSSYWTERKAKLEQKTTVSSIPNIEYETYGENLMAYAACGGGSTETLTRGKIQNSIDGINSYQNIREGILPYENSNGRISINTAIELTQRAYANVSIFRNAVEIMVEFSNSDIHLKGGNAASRNFVKSWLSKINVHQLMDEFFREYYRSGNVFMYRFDGKFRSEDYEKLKQTMGAKNNIVPVRYVILNPTNIFVENGVTGDYSYAKMLSTFEIERLKNPQTQEEKDMFNNLPEATKKEIKSYGGTNKYIYIPLDPKKLSYIFYKKQSYEPLAVPFGFPVLNDIEWKLQLKKMDMALSRTIEHAILLITTGAKPEEGGINQNNVARLQQLFKNPTIGRVLVADYTTKGQWLIPDFKELLGPEKYKIVDQDIREGLLTLMVGEDKFANAVIKAKVFIERLKEGQKTFLRNFLNTEMERVCKELNFKKIPTIEFEEIMLQDEAILQKIFVRMAELGILTPDETNNAIKTGVLPDKETSIENQKEYKKERDGGLYTPLIGGAKKEDGRPAGSKAPQTTKNVSPIGTGSDMFSIAAISKNWTKFDGLNSNVQKALKEKFAIESLAEEQVDIAKSIAKSIFANETEENWEKSIPEYIATPKIINEAAANEIDDIAIKYDLNLEEAMIIAKSRIVDTNKK